MIYSEYTLRSRRLKNEQNALNKRFIKEYRYRQLFGKVVLVRFRFRGKIQLERYYFEGLEPFYNDIIPVFKYLREDGTISKVRVGSIYSLKQIENILPIEYGKHKRDNKPGERNEESADTVCPEQGLADAANRQDNRTTC